MSVKAGCFGEYQDPPIAAGEEYSRQQPSRAHLPAEARVKLLLATAGSAPEDLEAVITVAGGGRGKEIGS